MVSIRVEPSLAADIRRFSGSKILQLGEQIRCQASAGETVNKIARITGKNVQEG
jgi:hypothetical protein